MDAARDYVRYAEQLEARFLPKRTEVLSFGSGDCGQLAHSSTLEDENDTVVAKPRVVKALTNKVVAQLSCGGLHNVAVTLDGVCFTWGCNDEGSLGREGDESLLYMPGAVSLPEKVTCVAAGGSQTFAVTLSGKVYGWGCYKDKEGKQWLTRPVRCRGNLFRRPTHRRRRVRALRMLDGEPDSLVDVRRHRAEGGGHAPPIPSSEHNKRRDRGPSMLR